MHLKLFEIILLSHLPPLSSPPAPPNRSLLPTMPVNMHCYRKYQSRVTLMSVLKVKILQNFKMHINYLRWLETVFQFPFQLNFMKGLLVCSKRLLLLVDSRCCNDLSTYQLLYSHWHFGRHGNLTDPQIHYISSIQLHFTQKVVGKLPFLLYQNCLQI